MTKEKILILDFGGQYNQLIARRVRENNVYCEVYTDHDIEKIRAFNPVGIILTGGPQSVYEEASKLPPSEIFSFNVPVLGICYGAQAMAKILGGEVEATIVSEYGKAALKVTHDSKLFRNVKTNSTVWMSHKDQIISVPKDFVVTAVTKNCPTAAIENSDRNFYAVQFHPEVLHTTEGRKIFSNFIDICNCARDWKMDSFISETTNQLKNKITGKRFLCALSGGVDSSVAAALLSKIAGKNLVCVFIDHGLLRKNEADEVENFFSKYPLNFIKINARKRFLEKLCGVIDPEQKRKIIGEEFIRVFEEVSEQIGVIDYLVQGTIYPDVIESGFEKSATIKSHHNVGGLPSIIKFKEIIEPLRLLFKDEVREVGRQLGLPEKILKRQPFPGPGLAVRIIGEITAEKIRIVQEADAIYREEILRAGIQKDLSQYFAALTNMCSVGVMGDGRTYNFAIVLRAVLTDDFMTAEAAKIPWEILNLVTNRIVNEVNGVNRVFYDCTSKPPATIEFE